MPNLLSTSVTVSIIFVSVYRRKHKADYAYSPLGTSLYCRVPLKVIEHPIQNEYAYMIVAFFYTT